MSESILINHDWRILVDPPADPVAKTKAGMYYSAKTERLKWGPGGYKHNDVPEYGSWRTELPEERWQSVDLPHDYIIPQTPDENETCALGYFHYVPAWYRKHFTLSPEDEGKRLAIYFEGITGISDIYLNGCFLKHNNGGYMSFEVDISDLARFDEENVLAVYVNPDSYETWWYEGGGIYRNVWLCKADTVSVPRWGVYVPVAHEGDDHWRVPVQVEVRNIGYDDVPVTVSCTLLDPAGNAIRNIELEGVAAARETVALKGETAVDHPQRWDVNRSNTLYTMLVEVRRNGVVCDAYRQTFGFRTVEWTAEEGIRLNGRPIKLKGVCGHLDFGLTGKAVSDNVCRYKMQLLKEMGANAFRTSHYPHQEATMNACDELGILVMDETRRFESCEDGLAQMEMMVRRDRNHPCVFLWSTGNEEVQYHSIPQGLRIHRALEHVAHKLDPARPVTCAVSDAGLTTIQGNLEVIGINYSLNYVEPIHNQFPDKPFFASECCAVGSTRGWYYGDSASRGYLDARDRALTAEFNGFAGRERNWKFVMSHPWHAGEFQWDAFEHRGEAIWPRLCSVSGACDLFLQRKDAFYQNQSHWLETPMIHVLPHWNHPGMEGMPVNVWVYTNCDEAELFLDGQSLGRRTVEPWTHLEWNVTYRPGELKAVGYVNGKAAAEDCRQTTGPAAALKLQLENGPVAANGEDVAVFTCIALDADGLEVPDAEPFVKFDCTGCGTIVGTGSSITDHTSVTCTDRRMMAGRITVAVKMAELVENATGELVLMARAEGLRGTRLVVPVTKSRG